MCHVHMHTCVHIHVTHAQSLAPEVKAQDLRIGMCTCLHAHVGSIIMLLLFLLRKTINRMIIGPHMCQLEISPCQVMRVSDIDY